MANDNHRAEVLRKNLRRLLRSEGLSQRDAAEEIGVRYKWMRRLCHHGLARIDRRTKASLEKVARYFKLEVDDLWNPRRQTSSPAWVLIKWAGSKRIQADAIVREFPGEIETYYEPFVGSGAVLYRLLCSDIQVKRFRCSDICGPLIDLWNVIKTDPRMLLERYEVLCGELEAEARISITRSAASSMSRVIRASSSSCCELAASDSSGSLAKASLARRSIWENRPCHRQRSSSCSTSGMRN